MSCKKLQSSEGQAPEPAAARAAAQAAEWAAAQAEVLAVAEAAVAEAAVAAVLEVVDFNLWINFKKILISIATGRF
jgi:hypothetical protein